MDRNLCLICGALACTVYLAAGRRDIGTAQFDAVMSPAIPAATQLEISARDVPRGHPFSISAVIGRASLAIALGRRTALRDLAAVTSAATIVAIGFVLRAAGVPMIAIALTMLAMMMGPTFWWRGVHWSADALTPAVGQKVGLTAEFTMLGLCLATIGSSVLALTAGWRLSVAMIVAGALYLTGVADLPIVICGWAAVAVGLASLLRVMPGRSGLALVTIAAVVLIGGPALSRMRLSSLGRDLDSSLEARAAYDLRANDLPPNAALIAESRRVDATARLSNIPIIAQTPDALDAALKNGLTPIAFPHAQSHLEQLGYLFEPDFAGNVPIAILSGQMPCINLIDGEWRDVTMIVATGSFILYGAQYDSAPGGAVIKVIDSPPSRVKTIEPRSIPFEVVDAADAVTIRVPRTGREDAVTVTLDSSPVSASATADEGNPVRMCPGVVRRPMLARDASASAHIHMNDSEPFVTGWHPIEADPDFFRWTAAPDAIVRVTMTRPSAVRVTITATPAARAAQHPSISLKVNSCRLASQPMQQGQGDYEWIAGTECWQDGVNQLSIGISPLISPASLFATHDTRLLGARIETIRMFRQNAK